MGQKVKIVPVILLGLGNVGQALVGLVIASRDKLEQRRKLEIRFLGVADSKGMVFNHEGLKDHELAALLRAKSDGKAIGEFKEALSLAEIDEVLHPGMILIDATAADTTSSLLREALENGCGVALSNKRPLVLPWEEVKPFFTCPYVGYEATVGAGLPVISTLRSLLDAGDRIESIDGLVSGTLGYLMSQLEAGTLYSTALSQARALGYTEPDPREDLAGIDVARKGVILARTAGWLIGLEDLAVTPLYPPHFAELPTEKFIHAISELDEEYIQRVDQAQKEGKVLRYVMHITSKGGEVGPVAVDRESILGALHGPGNVIVFNSAFYNETPLSVCGPGAGPRVTASGVLNDIIDLSVRFRKEGM